MFIGDSRTDALVKHGAPHETAENDSCFTVSPPDERNAETSRKQLLVEDGLRRLARMPPPRLRRPQVWEEVRADALRLGDEGQVEKALSLGWDPLHLFACLPDDGGNSDHEGLAVEFAGRTLLMPDRTSAIRDGPSAYPLLQPSHDDRSCVALAPSAWRSWVSVQAMPPPG